MNSKQQLLFDALLIFAEWVQASGYPVPTRAELEDIATTPDGYVTRLDSPVVTAWAPTIDELIRQRKFGVSPAIANDGLDDELRRPSGELTQDTRPKATPTPNSPDEPDPLTGPAGVEFGTDGADPVVEATVAALLAWKAERIAAGDTRVQSIKEMFLRGAAAGGFSAELIERQLPGNGHHAPEIARIIAEFSGQPVPRGEDTSGRTAPIAEPRAARHAAPREEPSGPSVRIPAPEQHRVDPASPRPNSGGGARDAGVLNLKHEDFEPFTHETPVEPNPAPLRVRTVDGRVRVSFEPHAVAGKMVVYRVVSGDDFAPYKPESGYLIAATTGLSVDDDRPLACAVRNYQVWCQVGTDLEGARRSQPFLLAGGAEVSPVRAVSLSQYEGQVIGEWTVHPNTSAVRIFRVPVEDGSDLGPGFDDPQHQISLDRDNRRGFVDSAATPGSRYRYRILAEATVGTGVRLSRAEQRYVEVDVVLDPIDDLEFESDDDTGSFELSWTDPPIGAVRVFFSDTPPAPTLRDLLGLEWSSLVREEPRFDEENRIRYPPESLGAGRSAVRRVPWPSGWDRAYFTPVTYLGQKVRVGTTRVVTRPLPPVRDAELVERFDTEMVKFSWPAGAASVWVFLGPATLSPEDICSGNKPAEEISRSKHMRDGGHSFARPLEAKGCKVCLVPVHYSSFDMIRGRITTLNYPGLHRIWYNLHPKEVQGRDVRELRLRHEVDLDSPMSVQLTYNRDRLPLSPDDGTALQFRQPQNGEMLAQCRFEQGLRHGDHLTGWMTDLTGLEGFVRLFVVMQGDQTKRFALADPSIREMFLPRPTSEPS